MSKSPEQLWKSMDALFESILHENHVLKDAVREAISKINQQIQEDADLGHVWEALAVLNRALNPYKTKEAANGEVL